LYANQINSQISHKIYYNYLLVAQRVN